MRVDKLCGIKGIEYLRVSFNIGTSIVHSIKSFFKINNHINEVNNIDNQLS